MPSRQAYPLYHTTFYVRLRGSSTGMAITGLQASRARETFAKRHQISQDSAYITVCRRPTKGVVYEPAHNGA